jgi:hypothetical protein
MSVDQGVGSLVIGGACNRMVTGWADKERIPEEPPFVTYRQASQDESFVGAIGRHKAVYRDDGRHIRFRRHIDIPQERGEWPLRCRLL